jgi:hypothetical protein
MLYKWCLVLDEEPDTFYSGSLLQRTTSRSRRKRRVAVAEQEGGDALRLDATPASSRIDEGEGRRHRRQRRHRNRTGRDRSDGDGAGGAADTDDDEVDALAGVSAIKLLFICR